MNRSMTSPQHSKSHAPSRLQERRATLSDERAFTLIELLVVLFIIGVLLAAAVPAYLGFEKTAQSTAAATDVREAIPDVTAYYSDNNSYTGMTPGSLRTAYDSGLVISSGGPSGIVSAKPEGTGQTYCISAVDHDRWAHYNGPGGTVIIDQSTVTADPCP